MFSGRVNSGMWPRMTMRSKQWYTKASTLPNSVAKVSIDRLPSSCFSNKIIGQTAGGNQSIAGDRTGKKGFKGTKPAVLFPCSNHPKHRPTGRDQRSVAVFKISNIFG